MGRGGRGKGKSKGKGKDAVDAGSGKGKGSSWKQRPSWEEGDWEGEDDEWADWGADNSWAKDDQWEKEESWNASDGWGQQKQQRASSSPGKENRNVENWGSADDMPVKAFIAQPKSLAAQWRFVMRVLRRHAPEERVNDTRRQLHIGDHVVAQSSWDMMDQHGIITSLGEEAYGRRGGGQEKDPWVVHCSAGRLMSSPLSQFIKGCELYRVNYPVWLCKAYVPTASTTKPYIEDEMHLTCESDEAVARQANNAYMSAYFTPKWSQGQDIEFCLQIKTGQTPDFEVHGRHALTSMHVAPIGCLFRGDRSPSKVFAGDSAVVGASTTAPPPGYGSFPQPSGGAREWLNSSRRGEMEEAGRPRMRTVQELEAEAAQAKPPIQAAACKYTDFRLTEEHKRQQAAASSFGFSVNAQEFVPGQALQPTQAPRPKSWEGIYQ